MTVTVLGLEMAFLLLALGHRATLQRRRTGDWGIRRPATASARLASTLMVGGFAGSGIAPIIQLLGLHRLDSLESLPVRVAGLALLGLAIVGTFHAQLTLGASWRVGVDESETTALVTTGQFSLVRHPIFTWMVIAATAVALTVPNMPAILGAGLVLCGVQVQARAVEEPHLLRQHGPNYLRYARQVGRFIPHVGTMRQPLQNARP